MRIGFACLWDRNAPATWSRTPWELRAALRSHADVVDVGVEVPLPMRRLLQTAHLRYRNGRLISLWEQGSLTDRFARSQLSRSVRRLEPDVVLEMQDLAPIDRPYFLYQDFSFDSLIGLRNSGVDVFRMLTTREMQRRRERQLKVYERATGVIAMSRWLAESLIKDTGLAPEKVHVVHPGLNAGGRGTPPDRVGGPRKRLLFIGRTFAQKGGDLVLQAFERLRGEGVTLTIAGPPTLDPVPDGVTFLGALPLNEIARLYDEHDLFVLPSRIEGFGIVFAEALSRGLPLIARNEFAMPEIVQAPRYGRLINNDDPDHLAGTILDALNDDELFRRCRDEAESVADYYSWDRAAQQFVTALTVAAA
jgi:glycosyltransferase involved in cell wall biosynthesis